MAFRSLFEPKWVRFVIILSIGVILNGLYFFYDGVQVKDFVLNYHRVAPKNKTTFETCADKFSTRTQPVTQNWQPVGNRSDIFVFSAYFNKEKKAVQVVGISLLQIKVECICTFTTSAATPTTTASANEDGNRVRGELEIIPENHGRRYSAIFIWCPVAEHPWPVTVNITVGNSSASLNVTRRPSERFNFTVCTPALHGPFSNPMSIIEMVEMDLLLGADRFIFYNESISPLVNTVLEHYTKRGIAEVISWKLPVHDIHYRGQLASVQDCLCANRMKSKFLLLKDVDEFIVPHKHKNWHELMWDVHDKNQTKASAYLFRNAFFDLGYGADVSGYKRKTVSQKLHLQSMLYVWREKNFFPARTRSKMIVLPDRVEISGIHFLWKSVKGFKEVTIDTNVAFLHHYRKWKNSEHKVKDEFLRKFGDRLIQNANKTLSLIGISITTGT